MQYLTIRAYKKWQESMIQDDNNYNQKAQQNIKKIL